jgi:hypothetical protein
LALASGLVRTVRVESLVCLWLGAHFAVATYKTCCHMVEGLHRVPARHPLYEMVAQGNLQRTLVEQSWAWLALAMCSCSAAHYFLTLPYLGRRGVASGLAGLLPIWNAGLSSGKVGLSIVALVVIDTNSKCLQRHTRWRVQPRPKAGKIKLRRVPNVQTSGR